MKISSINNPIQFQKNTPENPNNSKIGKIRNSAISKIVAGAMAFTPVGEGIVGDAFLKSAAVGGAIATTACTKIEKPQFHIIHIPLVSSTLFAMYIEDILGIPISEDDEHSQVLLGLTGVNNSNNKSFSLKMDLKNSNENELVYNCTYDGKEHTIRILPIEDDTTMHLDIVVDNKEEYCIDPYHNKEHACALLCHKENGEYKFKWRIGAGPFYMATNTTYPAPRDYFTGLPVYPPGGYKFTDNRHGHNIAIMPKDWEDPATDQIILEEIEFKIKRYNRVDGHKLGNDGRIIPYITEGVADQLGVDY